MRAVRMLRMERSDEAGRFEGSALPSRQRSKVSFAAKPEYVQPEYEREVATCDELLFDRVDLESFALDTWGIVDLPSPEAFTLDSSEDSPSAPKTGGLSAARIPRPPGEPCFARPRGGAK